MKKQVLRAVRAERPPGLFANEFPIKKKADLLFHLRKLKREDLEKGIDPRFFSMFSKGGKLMVKDFENSTPSLGGREKSRIFKILTRNRHKDREQYKSINL